MLSSTSLLFLISLAWSTKAWIPSTVQAAAAHKIKGFNYGSSDDFATKFQTAADLSGVTKESGYLSARLYQMSSTKGEKYTSAIDAAKATEGMTLLLGLWCSGKEDSDPDGTGTFEIELKALEDMLDDWVGKPGYVNKAKVKDLKSKIVGISIGSEDLYRKQQWDSGNKEPGWGNKVENLISFNNQTRQLLSKYELRGVIPIGHTDTNSAWTDPAMGTKLGSDLDFIALNTFPYWENAPIGDAAAHFESALKLINGVASKSGNPPVYIAETGWPISGPTRDAPQTDSVGKPMSNSTGIKDNNTDSPGAVPNIEYAGQYFKSIGCQKLFGKYNTWWYTLYEDPYSVSGKPQFAVAKGDANPETQYDLTCGAVPGTTRTRQVRKRQYTPVRYASKG